MRLSAAAVRTGVIRAVLCVAVIVPVVVVCARRRIDVPSPDGRLHVVVTFTSIFDDAACFSKKDSEGCNDIKVDLCDRRFGQVKRVTSIDTVAPLSNSKDRFAVVWKPDSRGFELRYTVHPDVGDPLDMRTAYALRVDPLLCAEMPAFPSL